MAGVVGVAAAAVVVSGAAGAAINHPAPGIWGRITAGPTCPVERPGQQCGPRGLAATVTAIRHRGTAGTARSNSAGEYAMGLRAGVYTIVVDTGAAFPRCPTKTVTVGLHQSVEVNILCDTGIR